MDNISSRCLSSSAISTTIADQRPPARSRSNTSIPYRFPIDATSIRIIVRASASASAAATESPASDPARTPGRHRARRTSLDGRRSGSKLFVWPNGIAMREGQPCDITHLCCRSTVVAQQFFFPPPADQHLHPSTRHHAKSSWSFFFSSLVGSAVLVLKLHPSAALPAPLLHVSLRSSPCPRRSADTGPGQDSKAHLTRRPCQKAIESGLYTGRSTETTSTRAWESHRQQERCARPHCSCDTKSPARQAMRTPCAQRKHLHERAAPIADWSFLALPTLPFMAHVGAQHRHLRPPCQCVVPLRGGVEG
ncbi:uncharacterized protein BJ171DRAFT_166063 [Polychytrium aggregatum]|uniref:uncharacterized protein n=1 Tax=Polychytrium aggregatum TaxID=110093 RepID=UPI0022FDF03A|nr:uncharacterized protein BJ171DRAFT_166063 [Polychytrium aggregatum]KAI9202710.1 hypothetical protein BJ171DRAFT_166063 [Polychytrium aggregatum]